MTAFPDGLGLRSVPVIQEKEDGQNVLLLS